jgi:hypothetical protein
MTNVFARPEKVSVRNRLFGAAEEALRKEGWSVDRIARAGKSSVRRITKGKVSKTVSIRTTQDTWIAFPRTPADDAWATLAEVDLVVAASVDDRDNPQFAQVHLIPGDEMRARFDRAYEARKKAGYTLPVGRGIWLSLYEQEARNPVTLVGAGAGLDHPAISKVPLSDPDDSPPDEPDPNAAGLPGGEAPLTIAEAKRRLAASLGVAESDIKITISS